MTLSASGLDQSGPIPVNTDQIRLWVGDNDRAIIRDVRFTNADANPVDVSLWIETPEDAVASFIALRTVPSLGSFSEVDAFIVLEPGWKVHIYCTRANGYLSMSGHWFPGAGGSD